MSGKGAVKVSRWIRIKDLARACRHPAKRVVSAFCERRNRHLYVSLPAEDLPRRGSEMYAEAGVSAVVSSPKSVSELSDATRQRWRVRPEAQPLSCEPKSVTAVPPADGPVRGTRRDTRGASR